MLVTNRAMEHLHYALEQSKIQNDRLTDELNGLRDKLNQQNAERRVRAVRVVARTDDHFAEIAIIRFGKDQMKSLIGKSIDSLEEHPDLITGLVDGRTVQVDGHAWTVRVRSVIIGETVHLYLEGQPALPQPPAVPYQPAP